MKIADLFYFLLIMIYSLVSKCLQNLARCFPQYGHLISATNPRDQGSVKKVRDLIVRYIKEERDKSWGSTTVDPCGLTCQTPLLDGAEEAVLEKGLSTVRA